MRQLAVLLALALGGTTVAADTHVTLTGATEGGEVCRFQAGDREKPFDRWLRAKDVTCVPAGEALTFSPGLWNVFARSKGAISADPILVDASRPPDTLAISLIPAAAVVIQLPEDSTGVLYSPKHVAAFPVSGRATVPAGEELWLFVMTKSVPVAVVPIPAIEAGSERVIDAPSPGSAPAVVGWVRLSDEDRIAVRNARGVQSPRIRVVASGKENEAVSLPAPGDLNGAFVLFRGALGGEAEVRLDGRGWLTSRRSFRVAQQPVTLLREPIVARASTTVMVNWSAYTDLPALDRSLGSCDPPKEAPRFELTISSCPEPKPGKTVDPSTCTIVRKETLRPELKFGTVTVDEVPPGTYRAELRYGKLPPYDVISAVPPLQQRPILLQALYLEAYGSLTRGGAPLGDDARIEFPGGGVGFAPGATGEFHAVLKEPFGSDAKIDIVTCSGKRAFVFTDREMVRRARFDIDIPDNTLTVTVIDAFTRRMLPDATLRFEVMSASMPRHPLMMRLLSASGSDQGESGKRIEGSIVINGIPERELRLTVTCPGYKQKPIDPFSMSKSEKREVGAELEPLSGPEGKIISSRSFENGTIFWFSADGAAETERSDLAPDGTFHFEKAHFRDETMTVVSSSHPLLILRAPAIQRATPLQVRFPDTAPQRDAEVVINGMPAHMVTIIGVAIGGLRVPQPALAQHLGLRSLLPVVSGAGPLIIPALAESAPIDILRGPSMQMRPPRGGEMLAARPFVPLATQRLVPGSPVAFLAGMR